MTFGLVFEKEEILKDNSKMLLIKADDLLLSLKTLKEKGFDLLISLFGTDTTENIEITYQLYSTLSNQKINLKVVLDRDKPSIESASKIFETANWNERETFDLLGVNFVNHPDLKRILLPNDWIGHPLRKDYKQNDERLAWNER